MGGFGVQYNTKLNVLNIPSKTRSGVPVKKPTKLELLKRIEQNIGGKNG